MESALQLWYFNRNWQQHTVPLPCGVMEIGQSLPGVIADFGGDSFAVQDRLRGVQQIEAARNAFAAIQLQQRHYLQSFKMDPS